MEYYSDRCCSKAYQDLIDYRQAALEDFLLTDDLVEYQAALTEIDEKVNKLVPSDFGLSNGDYFVDMSYGVRYLFKIEDDVLYQHSTNDVWYRLNPVSYNLENAMSLTLKGKWMRFREAPLG